MDAHWTELFEDFGDDCFLPYGRFELCSIAPPDNLLNSRGANQKRVAYLKHAISCNAPRLPGVYGMVDATGRLVYVGKSKMLRNRLLSYFMPNNEHDKAGRISRSAFRIVWEQQPSEFAALLREQQLIRRWLPRFNVVGMPNRRSQAFLCLGKGPGESLYLSRYNDATATCCVGPLSGIGHLNRAVEILTRHFRLRDCSQKTKMRFSEQLTLFDLDLRAGCVRHELGNCLGPCLPGSSRDAYASQVNRAVQFMRTGDADTVETLERAMKRASDNLHFETAAKIREDIRIVEWLGKRLGAYQKARDRKPLLYCVPGSDERPIWYFLSFGGVADVVAAPQSSTQWKACSRRIERWCSGETDSSFASLNPEETLGLVTSWLQQRSKNRRKIAEGDAQKLENHCWTAPLHEVPESWSEVKKWAKNQSLHRSVV